MNGVTTSVLTVSLALQLAAAILLMRLVGRSRAAGTAWVLLAFAMLLMSGRRVVTLVGSFLPDIERAFRGLFAELIALAIAVLMLAAVRRIPDVFRAVENAKAAEALEARVRLQASLADASYEALRSRELPALMDNLLRRLVTALGVPWAEIRELDPNPRALVLRRALGLPAGAESHAVEAGPGSLAGATLLAHGPVVVDDLHADPHHRAPPWLAERGAASAVSVPVELPDGSWGVLAAYAAEQRAFTRDEVYLVEALAHVLGAAIARRRAEDALVRNESLLAEAQLLAHVGSWEWDIRSDRATWSDQLCRLFGVAPGSFTPSQASFLERVHPDDREIIRDAIATALAGNAPFDVEHRAILPDGAVRWFHGQGRVMVGPDGRPSRLAGTAQDVTERKEAEQARLRLAAEQAAREAAEDGRKRAALLAEVSSVLAGSLDHGVALGRVASLVVPAWADGCAIELLKAGATVPAALAHTDPDMAVRASEVRRRWPPAIGADGGAWRLVATGETQLRTEVTPADLAALALGEAHRTALEALELGSTIVAPLVVRERLLGAMLFMTTRGGRRFDKADWAFGTELARRVALAVENECLHREAAQAIAIRDEYLLVAAHELRTPLTALLLQVQLAERAIAVGDGRLGDRIRGAVRSTQRLSALVERLLEVGRFAAGTLDIRPSEVSLSALVTDVADRLRSNAVQAGCELRIRAAETAVGFWDRVMLEQVFANLISNAIKYGAGQPIDVTVEATDDIATAMVRDSGIGIAKEDVEHIFGRFERAVSVQHYGGLGIGLYVARAIVERHSGTIGVTSTPGEGATFMVKLPRRTCP